MPDVRQELAEAMACMPDAVAREGREPLVGCVHAK